MGIGKRIREARIAHKLTQEELARRLGVTKGAVANYEIGTSHPKEPVLYKLFDALGVDANYLFQDVAAFPDTPGMLLNKEESDLIRRYRKLPDYLQETVSYMVNCALESPTRAQAARLASASSAGSALTDARIQKLYPDGAQEAASFKTVHEKSKKEGAARAKQTVSHKASITRFYPYLNYAASAGTGAYIDDIPTEHIEVPFKERADFVIGVSGASMEPDYQDGDLLYVEKTDSLGLGEVGIFLKDGSLLVKEVGSDRLISRNHDFPDIYAGSGDILTIGRVIGKVHPLDGAEPQKIH